MASGEKTVPPQPQREPEKVGTLRGTAAGSGRAAPAQGCAPGGPRLPSKPVQCGPRAAAALPGGAVVRATLGPRAPLGGPLGHGCGASGALAVLQLRESVLPQSSSSATFPGLLFKRLKSRLRGVPSPLQPLSGEGSWTPSSQARSIPATAAANSHRERRAGLLPSPGLCHLLPREPQKVGTVIEPHFLDGATARCNDLPKTVSGLGARTRQADPAHTYLHPRRAAGESVPFLVL